MIINSEITRIALAGMAGAVLIVTPLAAGPQGGEKARKTAQVHVIAPGEGSGGSFLGVNIWEVNAEVVKKKNLPEERGIIITSVVPDSAAEKAGLEKGDVVLKYNGRDVEGAKQFIRLVRETPPGRQVTLGISRNGEGQSVTATMGEKKSFLMLGTGAKVIEAPNIRIREIVIPDVPHIFTSWRSSKLGIIGESLESQLAEFFGVEEGVLVRSVGEDTPAERAGLKAGDVIVQVDDAEVATPREVTGSIREREGDTVVLTVVRNRQKMTIEVTLESGSSGGEIRMQRMFYSADPNDL